MEKLSMQEGISQISDSKTFSGIARVTSYLSKDLKVLNRVYKVDFSTSSATNWHSHNGIQILLITEGVCIVQVWNEKEIKVVAGDLVCFEIGEKHWHGASSDKPASHVAINFGDKTNWMEGVKR